MGGHNCFMNGRGRQRTPSWPNSRPRAIVAHGDESMRHQGQEADITLTLWRGRPRGAMRFYLPGTLIDGRVWTVFIHLADGQSLLPNSVQDDR